MRPTRTKSNPRQPLASQQLEAETKMMEEKLAFLKAQMEIEKMKKQETFKTSGSRWKTSTAAQPIKNYANVVMQAKQNTITPGTQKIDYAQMNKEHGKLLAQKKSQQNSLANTGTLMNTTVSSRPSSNSLQTRNTSATRKLSANSRGKLTTTTGGAATLTTVSSTPNQKGNINSPNPQQSSSKGQQVNQQKKQGVEEQNLPQSLAGILDDLGIDKYKDNFITHGFHDERKLQELNREKMTQMGIPPGFQIKILKRLEVVISEIALKAENSAESANNVTTAELQAEEDEDARSEKAKKEIQESHHPSSIEEPQKTISKRPVLEEQNSHVRNVKHVKPFSAKAESTKSTNIIATSSLKPPLVKKDDPLSDAKKVRFNNPTTATAGNSSSNNNTTNTNANNERERSPKLETRIRPTLDQTGSQLFHTTSIATGTENDGEQQSNVNSQSKQTCWQCYSLVASDASIAAHGKQFCSRECQTAYESYYLVKCERNTCGKSVNKQQASFRFAKWYCASCVPSDDEEDPEGEDRRNSSNSSKNRDETSKTKEEVVPNDHVDEQEDPIDETEEEYFLRKTREFEELDKKKKKEREERERAKATALSKSSNFDLIEEKYKAINAINQKYQ